MINAYSMLLAIHVAFGTLALLSFPIPMFASKGGPLHRRSGWVYVVGMAGVALTALLIGLWRIGFDPNPSREKISFALFLMMIAIFSGSAVWSGLRVLKFKNRSEPHLARLDFAVFWLRIGSAAAVSLYGFYTHDTLLSWFSVLPLVTGLMELRYWRQPPPHKMHWWFHHMESMFTACVGTVTAFTVTAAPRMFGPFKYPLVLWIAPTIVLIPISKAMVSRYRKKFHIK